MTKKVDLVLVGGGGFGKNYINILLNNISRDDYRIVAVVDINPDGIHRKDELADLGVKVYNDLEAFYAENHADLAIITTPIHFHYPHVMTALEHGSNVLCEKPLCALAEHGYDMINKSKECNKFLAVGFQRSYSENVLALKKDIADGRFGKPLRCKAIVLWPRDKVYFSRSWAGRIKDNQGRYILDSVANNATAHFLHNLFFLLSDKPDRVKAELYRSNPIENYDTAALRVNTAGGVELMYYCTHSVDKMYSAIAMIEFEHGTVYHNEQGEKEKQLYAELKDGSSIIYGQCNIGDAPKLWNCINAIRHGDKIHCTAEDALAHLLCINAVQTNKDRIKKFPDGMICENEQRVWADGLYEAFINCYEQWLLPSEAGYSWAQTAVEADVINFQGGEFR
ncbi:MAG: Inositol 2-dehydrogenase/D-chiro-inositol 3-dehydrogenase [Firmicutes bacterium ADurb.Bin193]|nr:MAG: Inositol 2-dehydrogenase/D-chiro-inositol 3-dehydrogenase [Firmicutes bacterium ADurb.Bin193]